MQKKQGFSLVEMAIVLVIVGLVTGGVLMGTDLLKAAEQRQIHTNVEQYIAALDSFYTKYEALPGDMFNATNVWDAADAAPATCIVTSTGDKKTCNGDGDERIWAQIGGQEYEQFRAWQQLSNAGLITGSYTGVAGGGGLSHGILNNNIPIGPTGDAGYTLFFHRVSGLFFPGDDYNHVLLYGGPTTSNRADDPVLSAADTWAMDNKIDDGKPATGNLRTYDNSTEPDCASSDLVTATYLSSASESDEECILIFITGF